MDFVADEFALVVLSTRDFQLFLVFSQHPDTLIKIILFISVINCAIFFKSLPLLQAKIETVEVSHSSKLIVSYLAPGSTAWNQD